MSRRTVLGLAGLGGLAATGLLAGCHGGIDLPSYTFPQDQLYYGASTPREKLASFEQSLGTRLSCYRSYFEAGQEALLHHQARADRAAGRMTVASIKPPSRWPEAASDTGWQDRLLVPLGQLGHQLFLCVHHEPENDSPAYGDAGDFIDLQDAVLTRAANKAPNVVITPILSTWSFDSRSNRAPQEWNVPDAAVYGLDVYNPWSPTNGKDWVTFGDKLALALDAADGRPIVVGEYGCRTDPTQPGRAATWMTDAFTSALTNNVVSMAYFNSSQNSPDGTWELDGETLPVFQSILTGPHVAWV